MSTGFQSAVRRRLRPPYDRVRRLLAADDLLQHGSIVAAATVVAGGFNYAFQVFMGRALGPEAYGVFGALFALLYLVNVLGRGVRFSAARFVAGYDDRATASRFHRGALLRALLLGGVIFAALALLRNPIGAFLGVAPGIVVVVAATVPPSLALTANRGTLDGRQRFLALGGYEILVAGAKLAFGVGLVLAGFGVYGAFGAIVAATVVTLAASTVYLRRRLGSAGSSGVPIEYGRTYRYGLPAVLAGFCLAVPANADVVLVKHAFPAAEAGLYTAASVGAKVLVFLPMGISTALFPKVSADESAGTGRQSALLRRGLVYAAAIGSAGALAYWVFPRTILTVFFGEAYAAAAPLLQWYGLAVVPFALAVVLLNYQLARDRTAFVYVFAAGSLAEILLIWYAATSMLGVVRIVLLTNAVLFALGVCTVILDDE